MNTTKSEIQSDIDRLIASNIEMWREVRHMDGQRRRDRLDAITANTTVIRNLMSEINA